MQQTIKSKLLFIAISFFTSLTLTSCNSSDVKDAIDDVQDVVDVKRKPIDTTRLGTNAFVNDTRFGSITSQFREVRDVIRLKYVRVLMRWDDAVQGSPTSEPNFSFYDSIVNELPEGLDAIVVLTGVPRWMSSSSNWVTGDPRVTFVERWVRKVVDRYKGNPRISGFEIWNEPNMVSDNENSILRLSSSPENYVEMLARAYSVVKDIAPGKKVIMAATTAINQNFPDTFRYNKAMRDAGVLNFTDVFNIHYYGRQFENVVRDGGIQDFLNGLGKGIYITETGSQGPSGQLKYGEEVWPFLMEKVPSIQRVYQYQFTDSAPAESSYGMRLLSGPSPFSDLYVFLRDR